MKNNVSNIFFLMLVIFTVSSCDESFNNVVEIEIPAHQPRLVSYCFMNANNRNIEVELSKSIGVLENGNESQVDGASVELLKDNEGFIDNFTYNYDPVIDPVRANYYCFYEMPEALDKKASYTLKIEAPGFTGIQAVSKAPELTKLTNINYEKDGYADPEGYSSDLLEIEFKDPAGEENFYLLKVFIARGLSQKSEVYLESLDPLIKEADYLNIAPELDGYFIYFNDQEGYDGQYVNLNFSAYLDIIGDTDAKLITRLYSIPKTMYSFILNYDLYNNSDFGIFGEPIIIPSNFSNGFGLFAIYDYDEMEIEL